jgi:hypothetical protein
MDICCLRQLTPGHLPPFIKITDFYYVQSILLNINRKKTIVISVKERTKQTAKKLIKWHMSTLQIFNTETNAHPSNTFGFGRGSM